MFFQSWDPIIRILIVGTLAYAAIVVLVRVSGKRTLAKMNAFDLIITVSLGSTLATILLNKKLPLAEGLTVFFLLIGLQYVIAWLASRFQTVDRLVKSNPKLLYYQNQYLRKAMKEERITEMDLYQAVRSSGQGSMEDVDMIILESNGEISVISATSKKPGVLLDNVVSPRK